VNNKLPVYPVAISLSTSPAKFTEMKKLPVLLFMLSSFISQSQNINHILNSANSILNATSLSNKDIVSGLKEALTIGSTKAGEQSSKTDGFYKNPLIKIPYPKETQNMMSTLKNLGMDKQVKDFEKQLNRAAEDAAKKAAPIFIDAIKKLTIQDGLTILKGKDDEATQFLKRNTTSGLTAEFKPVIAGSLKKVEITKYWKPLFTKYNKLPLVKKVNPDLENYVTEKAIEGLFKLVAKEELSIRKDPAARVTEILQKVFGAKK
jgi:hypothetical protein